MKNKHQNNKELAVNTFWNAFKATRPSPTFQRSVSASSFHKLRGGFTIIELIVAITIFIVVISISSSVFINSLKTQRAVLALMAANDNASLTIEQMSREIRTGSQFQANGSGDRLEFISAGGNPVFYQLQNNSIMRNGEAITAGNVRVVYLIFNLLGETPDDRKSTLVTINLGVGAVGKGLTDFITNIQTTTAVRLLDA